MKPLNSSSQGLMLGFFGVLIFSLTMPMTKIALANGALSAWFAWGGRVVLAALAGLLFLWLTRAKNPPRDAWWPLVGTTVGVVFGWPLLNALALQSAPSSHAAVINGILPLVTAVIGAFLNRERLSRRFWNCALAGTALVCGYAWWRADGALHAADWLMLAAVLIGGLGYACGAIAAKHLSGPEVISWALVIGLPGAFIFAVLNAPSADQLTIIPLKSWWAFVYMGLMSQWVGFFFWYRGLLLGGIAKVSQVQLIQLFLTLGFSALLLKERISPSMFIVAFLTLLLIFLGRRSALKLKLKHT